MEDIPICTNSYTTEAFDSTDSKASGYKIGSLHGPVKIWTREEIDELNKSREIEAEISNANL